MKKVWIVGANGHIGQALVSVLDVKQYELFETDKEDVDISDQGQVMRFVQLNRPDVIISCAGYNSTMPEERAEIDKSYAVNSVGARNVAQAAESIQAKLIYLSTDDVFTKKIDGLYNEFDEVSPCGVFGKSKCAGEKFVCQLMNRYVIIRSSWIYGIGKDFVNDVLAAVKNPEVTEYVLEDNSIAVPTSAGELAKLIKLFIDEEHYGVYHAVCSGEPCDRLTFAKEILKAAGKEDAVKITVKDNATEKYSALDNMMLRITGLPVPGDWKETLAEYIKTTGGLV